MNKPDYHLSLIEQVNNIEQEARMILPGIQTLFGFQLMVGLNSNFKVVLTPTEQFVHLIALLLVALAGILTVAPAAYHRQADHKISEHFVLVSSRFLAWALPPLALGTCLDIYLVTRFLGESQPLAWAVAGVGAVLYGLVWFIYPRMQR